MMQVSFAKHILQLGRWDSRDEMQHHLESSSERYVLLGENAEREERFHSILVYYSGLMNRAWGIGVLSIGLGIPPTLLLLPPSVLVVGNNLEAVALNVTSQREVFRFSFDTPFRAFIHLPAYDLLLIFNEIGVVATRLDGHEVWRYEKDIITEYYVEAGKLGLTFLDSPAVTLDLQTGKQ
jgi:hypothetical protein